MVQESKRLGAILYGKGGAKVLDVSHEVSLAARTPGVTLVIHVGGNDLVRSGPEVVVERLFQLIKLARSENPHVAIILSGIIPRPGESKPYDRVSRTNQLLEFRCAREGIVFIDNAPRYSKSNAEVDSSWFLSDGVHLNPRGEEQLTRDLVAAYESLKTREVSASTCEPMAPTSAIKPEARAIACCPAAATPAIMNPTPQVTETEQVVENKEGADPGPHVSEQASNPSRSSPTKRKRRKRVYCWGCGLKGQERNTCWRCR
jgi:hypothetical protein